MPITDAQKEQFKEAFAAIDTDGCGEVCSEELMKLVQAQGCNCTMTQINSFLSAHDKDANGKLNFDEFIELLGTLGF